MKTNLAEYMKPSSKIIKATEDLEKFYQLVHQENMKVYIGKIKQKGFKGTLREYCQLEEVKELMDGDGKLWEQLQKAIFLLEKYSTEVDTEKFVEISDDDITAIIKIIKEGINAHGIISKWVKPLEKEKDVIQALDDAMKLEMSKFQILKIADIHSASNEKIGLMDDILEIESPDDLINYLKSCKNVNDSLMVTFQRHKQFDFKGVFYLFLIYKGKLYSIDNSERRVNINNTRGARNPDRYLEKYCDIWLPFELFYTKNNKNKLPMVPGARVYKAKSFQKIQEQEPAVIYWLNMFIYRIMEHILNKKTKLEIGMTFKSSVKLLPYINKKHDYSSYKSIELSELQGAGAYLTKIFGEETSKEIVLSESHVPDLIGTKKYVQDVIEYNRRELFANQLQMRLNKDYSENHKKLYLWIDKFFKAQDVEKLVEKAMLDKKYSYMYYHQFTE